ncbi:uncharacterized protein FMAN_03630 [Fusarium mangiferae]|uniref:Rhodopsin domain-containing protein n=1 Tax=Fusarium mangiferae TaxID=192010 RepID=A0A1L7T7K2_FUSMA|nr:uncharacterized protein FMAN_03630 [Fusarium mangiferae]CVK94594.1 uncharacterized protein FMAN_03630 [Fusarium mangiferae]
MLILVTHPPDGPDGLIPSVEYQKIVWVAEYFFDTGIYWPKLSILAFYWYLIPDVFQSLRLALYAITAYLVSCMTTSILLNTLIARPISDNWSVENQLNSAWNSLPNFLTQWCLNFSTDLILFCFPFFILKHLTLRTEQKLGLVGVFSLGAITMSASLARFIISNAADYQLDYPSGSRCPLHGRNGDCSYCCLSPWPEKIDHAIEIIYQHDESRVQLEPVKLRTLFKHDGVQIEDCIAGLCGMGCHGR